VTGIILLLTANPYYAYDGVRPGARLTGALEKRLRLGTGFAIGANDWYVAVGAKAGGVLKVRGGIVQEVGVGDRRLLGSRPARLRFLRSFSDT
jgi:hypothetical protein